MFFITNKHNICGWSSAGCVPAIIEQQISEGKKLFCNHGCGSKVFESGSGSGQKRGFTLRCIRIRPKKEDLLWGGSGSGQKQVVTFQQEKGDARDFPEVVFTNIFPCLLTFWCSLVHLNKSFRTWQGKSEPLFFILIFWWGQPVYTFFSDVFSHRHLHVSWQVDCD